MVQSLQGNILDFTMGNESSDISEFLINCTGRWKESFVLDNKSSLDILYGELEFVIQFFFLTLNF